MRMHGLRTLERTQPSNPPQKIKSEFVLDNLTNRSTITRYRYNSGTLIPNSCTDISEGGELKITKTPYNIKHRKHIILCCNSTFKLDRYPHFSQYLFLRVLQPSVATIDRGQIHQQHPNNNKKK